MSPALRRTAYHEAGHAFARLYFGMSVRRVTIVPDPARGTLGTSCHYGHKDRFRALEIGDNSIAHRVRFEREIIQLLAGRASEKLYTEAKRFGGSRDDLGKAADIALGLSGSIAECNAYLRWLNERTKRLLDGSYARCAIPAIADELLRRKTLTRDVLRSVFIQAGSVPLRPSVVEAIQRISAAK